MSIRLRVNGMAKDVDCVPATPLLWVLRDDFGFSSPKYGCGADQCGACRVLVEGRPMASCTLAVGDVAEREVTTLEALVDEPAGQRVIDALLARNAGQCGYCLPGIAVTLTAIVRAADREAAASTMSRTDLAQALDGHLCRCGSQPRILQAGLDALAAAGDV